jgi:hypothetical protein
VTAARRKLVFVRKSGDTAEEIEGGTLSGTLSAALFNLELVRFWNPFTFFVLIKHRHFHDM